MISVPRKARPRRSPNRVRLVEPDGSPVRDHASLWPASTDNWFWTCNESPRDPVALGDPLPIPEFDVCDGIAESDMDWFARLERQKADEKADVPIDRVIGTDSMGGDIYESDCHEPSAEDLVWLAQLQADEAAERERIAATYRPTTADLAGYGEWLASLGDGPEPYAVDPGHAFEEWEAVRRGQVSPDELSMLAAHGCV